MNMWVGFHSRCGGEVGTEASCPAQEHGAALGAPGAQLVLHARPLLSGEPWLRSGWDREEAEGEARGLGEKGMGAGSREGLALGVPPPFLMPFSTVLSCGRHGTLGPAGTGE